LGPTGRHPHPIPSLGRPKSGPLISSDGRCRREFAPSWRVRSSAEVGRRQTSNGMLGRRAAPLASHRRQNIAVQGLPLELGPGASKACKTLRPNRKAAMVQPSRLCFSAKSSGLASQPKAGGRPFISSLSSAVFGTKCRHRRPMDLIREIRANSYDNYEHARNRKSWPPSNPPPPLHVERPAAPGPGGPKPRRPTMPAQHLSRPAPSSHPLTDKGPGRHSSPIWQKDRPRTIPAGNKKNSSFMARALNPGHHSGGAPTSVRVVGLSSVEINRFGGIGHAAHWVAGVKPGHGRRRLEWERGKSAFCRAWREADDGTTGRRSCRRPQPSRGLPRTMVGAAFLRLFLSQHRGGKTHRDDSGPGRHQRRLTYAVWASRHPAPKAALGPSGAWGPRPPRNFPAIRTFLCSSWKKPPQHRERLDSAALKQPKASSLGGPKPVIESSAAQRPCSIEARTLRAKEPWVGRSRQRGGADVALRARALCGISEGPPVLKRR